MLRIPEVSNQKIRRFRTKFHIGSIEPAGSDTVWVCGLQSDSLYLTDISGTVESITVKGSGGINDIAVNRMGDLIVTCTDKRVRYATMTGKITELMDVGPFLPQGVCLTDKEEILVCMSDQGDENHVAVYSPDGRINIRDIVAKDDDGKLYFSDPYRVVVNGECVTVLNRASNVVTVDQSGKVIWVYDGSQTELSEAFDPWGMCKDKYSNIIILDNSNHCVHGLNREGVLLQIIIKPDNGFRYPFGVALSRDSEILWLGSSIEKEIRLVFLWW